MDFDNLGYGNELQELAIAGERKKSVLLFHAIMQDLRLTGVWSLL